MSGSNSVIEVLGTTPRMGRRSMALSDIDPKYVSQSGIWEASEVETSRGSIRIQHLTSTTGGPRPFPVSSTGGAGAAACSSRFAQLEDCAHFHYDSVELPPLKISIRTESSKAVAGYNNEDTGGENCAFSIEVVSGGLFWAIRRTHANVKMLDDQLHCCVWDRSFSQLEKVENCSEEQHDGCRRLVERYLARLSQLPTNQITCGTVLSWLELDNRGRHIVSSDDSAINTPAVAAACAKRKYTANAADEISFEVGDMISVIDMPPPEESIWWRGKRGFHVGFFPRDYVQVIGDKVPMSLPIVPSTRRLQRLSVSSSTAPEKPVLRKHGKLIAFFRSFILSRPSRRRLKQTGILRERVFGCDLAEHLLNSGSEIPAVLKCCAEFIEMYGIVDGIYRLSGITSNIQKLRISFDEDKVPNLEEDEAIKSDIHAVSSLLKMYFRELPNPLCTYQLYEKFVLAAQAADKDRLFRMREVVHELPPPHYRTLEYLMKHLARVAEKSSDTGMTPKNMAIVWAPNLFSPNLIETDRETLISRLKGIGVQAVVTEYLVRHSDLIFRSELPPNLPPTTTLISSRSSMDSETGRPKSLSISSPIRLMSLEEAQDKAKDDRKFIEVGGGPSSLPPKYHTVIDLPSRRAALKSKRSPTGWRHFFSRNRSFSKPPRKISTPIEISTMKNMPGGMHGGAAGRGRLRPVKSVESLVLSPNHPGIEGDNAKELDNESVAEIDEAVYLSKSSPATPISDVHVVFHHPPPTSSTPNSSLLNTKTHNRSISHDSYFEFGEFKTMNNVYIDETLEEETLSQSSKLSLEDNSSGMESNTASPKKVGNNHQGHEGHKVGNKNNEEDRSRNGRKFNLKSPITPPPSVGSIRAPLCESVGSGMSTSSDDFMLICETSEKMFEKKAAALGKPPRPPTWRDSEVQTSCTKLFDVGVSTNDDDIRNNPMNLMREQGTHTETVERRPSVSSNDNGNYELDRNSSVDESSNDSTPGGEQFSMTNIIYSPLVNEILSPEQKKHSSSVSIQPTGSSLYICPLYEVGGGSEDVGNLSPIPMEAEVSSMRISDVSSAPSLQSFPHEYENVGEPTSSPTTVVECAEPKTRTHVYANDHLYENTLVKGGMIISGDLFESEKGADGPEELYGGEHYENVSDGEMEPKPIGSESNYESNIYEDIDDESIVEKNNYETIEISSLQSGTTSPHSKQPDGELLSDNEGEPAYESVRFQRGGTMPLPIHHYAEIPEKKRLEAQYVNANAVGDGSGRVVLSGTSSPSYSNTEDIVTYLEIQTPRMKVENSLESNDDPCFQNYESFDGSIVSPSASIQEKDEGEIRHIDSPILVDNPLYGVQPEEFNDVNGNKQEGNSREKPSKGSRNRSDKVLERCNSAPLVKTDFHLSLPGSQSEESRIISSPSSEKLMLSDSGPNSKMLLCKRLSEPTLSKSATEIERSNAWKAMDAKRLANRKQSVKELLSKFETKEGSMSPTGTTSPLLQGTISPGPGLPRPEFRIGNLNRTHNNRSKSGSPSGGNARLQHHRFSMGDILMSQSMSSAEELKEIKSVANSMIRSDTFPELRTEASKENKEENTNSENGVEVEKVQHAIRVAMSSVDMNDPSTRERIEKYKEERRMFLRQKISSELTGEKGSSSDSKGSVISFKSPERDSISSNESVFGSHKTLPVSNDNISLESPRKRAFSEDVPPAYSNQTKAIKTEPPKIPTKPETRPSYIESREEEEVNVREKVAMWTTNQKRANSFVDSSRKSKKEVSGGSVKVKPVLKEATSLPPDGFSRSQSSIEFSPIKENSVRNEGGKKIKDMAAFFEAKRF